MLINNSERTDDKLIAEALGNYFAENSANLEAGKPQTRIDPLSLKPLISESMFFNLLLPLSATK